MFSVLWFQLIKLNVMKKQSIILIVMVLLWQSSLLLAQEEAKQNLTMTSQSKLSLNQKGEFSIGIQDLSTTSQIGGNFFSINPRFGYMISNYDMIFIDGRYTHEDHFLDGYRLEFRLNYRRYFGESKLRFFIQADVGYGYSDYRTRHYNTEHYHSYFMAGTGAGFSFKYKRWTFETGMKLEYNTNGSGRIEIQPMIGVSFSF